MNVDYPCLNVIPLGFVAGSVIDRLLRHHSFATSEITVLTRKVEKASAFESLGIKTVVGFYDDHALLEKHAALSDVVISCVRMFQCLVGITCLHGFVAGLLTGRL